MLRIIRQPGPVSRLVSWPSVQPSRYALHASCRWEVPVTTGPDEGVAAGRGQLRAAHADREHVIDLLKAAFVQGRLTKDELDVRAGQALTARTYAQLAALTGDIPGGPLAGPPAGRLPAQSPARPPSRPKRAHPVRNAAIGSGSCLTVGFLSFCYGAHLDDHTTLVFLWVTLLALLAAIGVMGCGIVSAVAARQSRGQLPPRPGQGGQAPGGQRHSSTGDDPPPPGTRIGQPGTDLRAHRSRPRPSAPGVPVPRRAMPAPGAA
jgi:hypothetical protein